MGGPMILKIIAITGLLLLAEPALAGEFHVAPHGSYKIDLDTQDGNFSQWETSDVSDINTLHAHITFLRKGSGNYAPIMTMGLMSGGKSVYIQFVALAQKGPLFGIVHGTHPDDQGTSAKFNENRQLILTPPEFSEGFDVHVSWTPEGKVSFDIYDKANASLSQGFEHHEVQLDGPVTSVRLSNSTSEVEFNKLELGVE